MDPCVRSTARALPKGWALCTSVTLGCLAWTLATGALLGLKSALPALGVDVLPLQLLHPLHTLGVVSFLEAGVLSLFAIAMHRNGARCSVPPSWSAAVIGTFVASGAGAIVMGRGSGLEYTPWPLALTALPVVVLAAMGWDAWRGLGRLSARAPEGAWLLLVGLCLTPLGLIERIAGAGYDDASRALMVEWHALDTVFAGFNTSLYGLGILLTAPPGRRPRGLVLYGVATFALLSTFGHHHYVSAQPHVLKMIAFGASMLGVVSFIRHVRALRGVLHMPVTGTSGALIGTGALWTLYAVGSGVVLAVPHVNLILHGTHAIVAHSMGAVIGVNVAIVLGALLDASPGGGERAAVHRLSLWFNIILALIVLDLLAAGVVKGVMRIEGTHHDYQPVIRSILAPLPLLGVALAGVIGCLSVRIARGIRVRAGPVTRVETAGVPS